VLPLAMYGVGTQAPTGLVVGYGAIQTERIGEGLRRLRRCFDDCASWS
jgi:GntR family transcriptional regulator / MocR family aminotransferase